MDNATQEQNWNHMYLHPKPRSEYEDYENSLRYF